MAAVGRAPGLSGALSIASASASESQAHSRSLLGECSLGFRPGDACTYVAMSGPQFQRPTEPPRTRRDGHASPTYSSLIGLFEQPFHGYESLLLQDKHVINVTSICLRQ
jgi:hypothetical protein